MRAPTPNPRLGLAAGAAAVLLVALLWQVPVAPVPAPAGAALRVQWDPEAGAFVPEATADKAAAAAAMAEALNRSSDGLRQQRHPDGRVSVDLQGRFRSLSVATTDTDGTVRTGCVTDRDELDAFLGGAPVTDHGKER